MYHVLVQGNSRSISGPVSQGERYLDGGTWRTQYNDPAGGVVGRKLKQHGGLEGSSSPITVRENGVDHVGLLDLHSSMGHTLSGVGHRGDGISSPPITTCSRIRMAGGNFCEYQRTGSSLQGSGQQRRLRSTREQWGPGPPAPDNFGALLQHGLKYTRRGGRVRAALAIMAT
eukprot:gene2284-6872_t